MKTPLVSPFFILAFYINHIRECLTVGFFSEFAATCFCNLVSTMDPYWGLYIWKENSCWLVLTMCGALRVVRGKTILQRKQPSCEFTVREVTTCWADVFLCIQFAHLFFFSEVKNHLNFKFSMSVTLFSCSKIHIKTGWGFPVTDASFLIQRILCTTLNLEQQHLFTSQRHNSINVFRVVFPFKGCLDFGILVRASGMGELKTHQGESRLGWRLS